MVRFRAPQRAGFESESRGLNGAGDGRLSLQAVVKGAPDAAAVRAIASLVEVPLNTIYFRSKPQLLKGLPGFNNAARFWPWLVVVDLDSSAPCAPTFVHKHLRQPSRYMRFRVAVREVEAWLMSDKLRMAGFLGVSPDRVPDDPEALPILRRRSSTSLDTATVARLFMAWCLARIVVPMSVPCIGAYWSNSSHVRRISGESKLQLSQHLV